MKFGIKFWHPLCLAFASAFYLAFIWKNSFLIGQERYFSLFDDAMIAMRYAKNLADGYGLRWNPGEPPIEGYTNLLWTLYMAAIHLLPIAVSKTSLVVMLSGAGLLLGNLILIKRITEAIAPQNSYAPLLAVFLTAFYFPLIFWTLRGMEVGLLCLLTNAAVLLAFRLYDGYSLRDVIALTVIFVAALLTRPDMVVPLIVIGAFLLHVIRQSGFKASYLLIPTGVVITAGGLFLFRIKYYGDSLPNTYYLKVSGVSASERASRGLAMLEELCVFHLWPVLLLLAFALWKSSRRCSHPKRLLLLGIFLAQTAYSVYVGGDAWEWMHFSNRYIVIAVPILFVVISTFLSDSNTHRLKTVALFLPLLSFGFVVESFYYFRVNTRELATASVGVAGLFMVVTGIWIGSATLRHRPISAPLFAFAVTLIIGVALNFFGIGNWILGTNNGGLIAADSLAVREGLALRRVTSPNARIAYIAAGAMPYFAERKAVDLLGRSDRVIAKGNPAAPFYPGHSKWNYDYSIGQLKPDLVPALWAPTKADGRKMADWGYALCTYGYYLKESCNLNRTLLEPCTP
jgi:hypothetical protein